MSRHVIIVSVFLTTAGCAPVTLPQVSSGHVGCQPEEIRISDERTDLSGWRGWKATCHGTVYICSAAGHDVACHPES
jgi:hypothetical protein